jgi:hypothetical protein
VVSSLLVFPIKHCTSLSHRNIKNNIWQGRNPWSVSVVGKDNKSDIYKNIKWISFREILQLKRNLPLHILSNNNYHVIRCFIRWEKRKISWCMEYFSTSWLFFAEDLEVWSQMKFITSKVSYTVASNGLQCRCLGKLRKLNTDTKIHRSTGDFKGKGTGRSFQYPTLFRRIRLWLLTL